MFCRKCRRIRRRIGRQRIGDEHDRRVEPLAAKSNPNQAEKALDDLEWRSPIIGWTAEGQPHMAMAARLDKLCLRTRWDTGIWSSRSGVDIRRVNTLEHGRRNDRSIHRLD